MQLQLQRTSVFFEGSKAYSFGNLSKDSPLQHLSLEVGKRIKLKSWLRVQFCIAGEPLRDPTKTLGQLGISNSFTLEWSLETCFDKSCEKAWGDDDDDDDEEGSQLFDESSDEESAAQDHHEDATHESTQCSTPADHNHQEDANDDSTHCSTPRSVQPNAVFGKAPEAVQTAAVGKKAEVAEVEPQEKLMQSGLVTKNVSWVGDEKRKKSRQDKRPQDRQESDSTCSSPSSSAPELEILDYLRTAESWADPHTAMSKKMSQMVREALTVSASQKIIGATTKPGSQYQNEIAKELCSHAGVLLKSAQGVYTLQTCLEEVIRGKIPRPTVKPLLDQLRSDLPNYLKGKSAAGVVKRGLIDEDLRAAVKRFGEEQPELKNTEPASYVFKELEEMETAEQEAAYVKQQLNELLPQYKNGRVSNKVIEQKTKEIRGSFKKQGDAGTRKARASNLE